VININGSNFWLNLPVVINAISTSEFVSFDLEMTGVRTRADNWTESMVQHLYLQAKAAAQIFNVLQIGISCASYSEGDEGKLISYLSISLPTRPITKYFLKHIGFRHSTSTLLRWSLMREPTMALRQASFCQKELTGRCPSLRMLSSFWNRMASDSRKPSETESPT